MNIKRKVSRLTALMLILTVALMGASELAAGPLAPDTLYVDDTNAQSGTRGHPVGFIDTTPVFSFVVRFEEEGEAYKYEIQVATDSEFSSTVWSSSYISMTTANENTRTVDIAYAGSTLSSNTLYYWRVRFEGEDEEESPWSTEIASFMTGDPDLLLDTISSFPWYPSESDQATKFFVDMFDNGILPSGSAWQNGTISYPRRGSNGASDQAWANQPTKTYGPNTVSWLQTPIFDLSSISGMSFAFELWIKANHKYDGVKMQVSTNGSSTWSDVSTTSLAYNGHTNKSSALSDNFGGSDSCWTKTTTYGGWVSNTCTLNLNAYIGQSDVRFRFCMGTGNERGNYGPVLDTFRIEPVTATIVYQGGFAAVPQDGTVTVNVSKTNGSAFVSGMTVTFNGTGLTGTVTSVTDADNCVVDISANRVADVGGQTFYIDSGSTRICQGMVDVLFPQQLVSYRQGGSTQEPTRNATMGGNSVYLHNGEFRHDLPILSLPGRMLPMSVGITYRSQLHTIGSVGAGWTASFDRQLFYLAGSDEVEVRLGSGSIRTYSLASGGTAGVGPYHKTGCFYTISRDTNSTNGDITDDVFTFNYAHGSTATFEAINLDVSGAQVYRETAFADRYGNKVSSFYNDAGQITEIQGDMFNKEEGKRHRLLFDYNDHGRLTTIVDYADYSAQSSVIGSSYIGNRKWEFLYNSDAQLTDILLPKTERYYSNTKGANYRTRVTFTYDANDNLLEVIDARQNNESTPLG
ncbi:MAG: DUF6531 domain-containing protein, partial [Planctomycetota bacterium]